MSKSNVFIGAIAGLALLLSVIGLVGGNNQSTELLGGSRFQGGLSTGDTAPSAGDLIVSDDIDLEAAAFCIDFHATSTDTVLSLTASSTATLGGDIVTEGGVMLFNYGSCQ